MSAQGSVRLPVIAAIAVAVALSGCVTALNDLRENVTDRLAGEEPPRPDEAFEWAAFVAPQFNESFPFPVNAGAVSVTGTVTLAMVSPLPAPFPVNTAEVTVHFEDAAGNRVSDAVTLDPQTAEGSLTASDVSQSGTWSLVASGMGLSGNEQGARVNATLLVGYGAAGGS